MTFCNIFLLGFFRFNLNHRDGICFNGATFCCKGEKGAVARLYQLNNVRKKFKHVLGILALVTCK